MTHSILSDWHVATQLGLSGTELKAFLSAIEYIRQPQENDTEAVFRALTALHRQEHSVQVYVLEDTCRLMRQHASAASPFVARFNRLVEAILSDLPAKLKGETRRAVSGLIGGDPAPTVIAQLSGTMRVLLNRSTERRQPKEGPANYDEIEEHDLSALVLAIILTLAREESEPSSSFVSTGDKGNEHLDQFAAFISAARSGYFGRHCLLLSIDIGIAVPDLAPKSDLLKDLHRLGEKQLLLEPDLVPREILLSFDIDRTAGDDQKTQALESLINELLTFSHWSRLAKPLYGERIQTRDITEPNREEIRKCLSSWQNAIWHVMLGLDPAETARRLSRIWLPRILNSSADGLSVSLPLHRNQVARTATLHRLLAFPFGRESKPPQFTEGPIDEHSPYWCALSPWLPAGRWDRGPKPSAIETTAATAAAFAARLLATIDPVVSEGPDLTNIASFLLASIGDLHRFRNMATHMAIAEKGARDSFVLYHTCRTLAQNVAGGRLLAPDPAFFVATIDSVVECGFADIPDADGIRIVTARERQIKAKLVGNGLRLIEFAMQAPQASGRSRWLHSVEPLTTLGAELELEKGDELLRRLLVKFVLKNHQPDQEDADALQELFEKVAELADTGRRPDGLWHRVLLLDGTGEIEALRWETLLGKIAVDERNGALVLTLATEVLAATLEGRAPDEELRKRSVHFLQQQLDRLSDEMPFDRFVRLRLFELLKSGLLADEPDLTLTIAGRLVEFGSAHDLQLLAKWMSDAPVGTPAQVELRRHFFRRLLTYRQRAASRVSGDAAGTSDADSERDGIKRLELLGRVIICSLVPRNEDNASLAEHLRALARDERDEVFRGIGSAAGRVEPFTTALNGSFSLAAKDPGLVSRSLAIGIDREGSRAWIIDPVEGQPAVLDLFHEPTASRKGAKPFFGVVDRIVDGRAGIVIGPHDGDQFDVDRGRLPTDARLGDLVAVNVDSTLDPRVDGDAAIINIARLPRKQIPPFRWARMDLLEGSAKGLPVTLEGMKNALDWGEQTCNFLMLHQLRKDGSGYGFWVKASEDQQLAARPARRRKDQPATLDFVSFLLDHPQASDTAAIFVLCLFAVERGADGEPVALVVDTLPAQRYRFQIASDLADPAREAIFTELERLEGEDIEPEGLLIAVKVASGPMGPMLELVAATSGSPTTPHYEVELETPFDRRNIEWRQLLAAHDADDDDEQSILMHGRMADDAKYVIADLPNDMCLVGFPAQITVTAHTRQGRRPQAAALVDVLVDRSSWDPFAVRAEGDLAERNDLSLSTNDDVRKNQIRNILALERTGSVKLRALGTRVDRNGLVMAFTQENLRVRLAVESLTMRAVKSSAPDLKKLAGSLPRKASIDGKRVWRRVPVTPEIVWDDLPGWVLQQPRTFGLLTSIPHTGKTDAEGSAVLEVAWKHGEEIETAALSVVNFAAFNSPLWQGARVVVETRGESRTIWFENTSIHAEALWEEIEEEEVEHPDRATYVGSATIDGERRHVYEVEGGEFFTSDSEETPDFLPDLMRLDLVDTGTPIWWQPKFKKERSQRCRIEIHSEGKYVCGLKRQGQPAGPVLFSAVDLAVTKTNQDSGSPKYLLRRRFKLLSQSAPKIESRKKRSKSLTNIEAAAQRTMRLEEWIGSYEVLEGEYDRNSNTLRFHSREQHKLFPDGLEVTEGHLSWSRRHAPYRNKAIRAIAISEDPAEVSCRDVRALTLESFEGLFSAARGNLIRLDHEDVELYMVGIRRNENPDGSEGELEYLLEWGYGFWMSLPGSKIRFQGEAFETSNFRLYVEDRILSARINEEDGELLLDIESAVPSQAHQLFTQAARDKIIHPLTVQVNRAGEATIRHIDGFNPNTDGDPRQPIGSGGMVSGRIPELDAKGVKEVEKRLRAAKRSLGAGWKTVLLGRLNTKAYRESYGARLAFEYVRLTAKASEEAGCLRNGDRVFAVTGNALESGENDMALKIERIQDLPLKDVGQEFTRLQVQRRAFSARQDTLPRLWREKRDLVEDQAVMVRIGIEERRWRASILDGAPLRGTVVLDTLLGAGTTEVFAIIAPSTLYGGSGKELILVELRPGVLVGIPADSADAEEQFLPGDIVRIAQETRHGIVRYIIARAVYGDIRYASHRRPVVALPMQNLARERFLPPYERVQDEKTAFRSFTVGDMPDLRTRFRILSRDREPIDANIGHLKKFMALEHPKLAWLQAIEQQEGKNPVATIVPDFSSRIMAGRLVVGDDPDKQQTSIQIEPVSDASERLRGLRTDWYLLSHGDLPGIELRKAAASDKWQYHDKTTVVWKDEERVRARAPDPKIPESSSLTGPVFFEEEGNEARLRYSRAALPAFAIGYSNLIDTIAGSKGRTSYPVAGVPDDGGLYVELALGRVAEIPPAMVTWGHGGGARKSLRDLDWGLFAAGDVVVVSPLQEADPYKPRRLLMDWEQSVRNAFGPKGAVLKRHSVDEDAKCATYGAREYTVCIPSETPGELPGSARIGGCKVVESLSEEKPLETGDTVLIVLGADGSIEVEGFADWSIYPDRKWNFENDRFMYGAVYMDGADRKANRRRVAERIKIAGGALPVTVEYAHKQPNGGGKTIFFSTRNQELIVEKAQNARAIVRGQLPGSGWIVVQVGGRLGALPPDDLIKGLPERLLEKAIAVLRDQKIPVWLHGGSHGLEYGVPDSESKQLTVHPQYALEVGVDAIEGIICAGSIDQRLRWLPAERAAATPLTPEFAERAFTKSKGALKVFEMEDGSVSVLDHPKVARELSALTIGSQLSVQRITPKNAEHSLWMSFEKGGLGFRLVRSRATGLVMTAAVQGKGPHFRVEVAERRDSDRNCYLLLVQSGHRQAWTDFPALLDNAEPVGGATARNPFCKLMERDPEFWQRTMEIKAAFSAVMQGGVMPIAEDDLWRYATAYRSTEVTSLLGGIGAAFLMARSVPTGDDHSLALLRDIATRAQRSIHLELLGSLLLERSEGQSHEAPSVAKRIDALLLTIRQQRQDVAAVPAGIERLYDDLTLNGRLDYDWAIVDALATSLGQPANLGRLLSDESRISYTSDSIRTLRLLVLLETPTRGQISGAVERLALIGQRMLQNEVDVPMTRAVSSGR